jgi:hypothetical protein
MDFPDLGGRGGHATDRFLLFVEQLEEAVRLLKTGRLAGQRMALVALDALAEGLLFRHMDRVFLASDQPVPVVGRTFTVTERRAARDRFTKRVALATERFEGMWEFMYPEPLLDQADAAIFRVAHHYRNPVYHRDRHNPTLIEPVGKLYAQAVGRAFVRAQRWGVSMSASPGFISALVDLGWSSGGRTYFEPREAARDIAARICDPLRVDALALRSELADDIAYRCDAAEEDIAGLRRDGLDKREVEEFLTNVQDWAASRGDEGLLQLQAEHKALLEKVTSEGTSDPATLHALRQSERKQWAYLFGPDREPAARVTLGSLGEIRSSGERLRGWGGSVGDLLRKYQTLDDRLEMLESALDFMLMEWDRIQSMEEDLARGK